MDFELTENDKESLAKFEDEEAKKLQWAKKRTFRNIFIVFLLSIVLFCVICFALAGVFSILKSIFFILADPEDRIVRPVIAPILTGILLLIIFTVLKFDGDRNGSNWIGEKRFLSLYSLKDMYLLRYTKYKIFEHKRNILCMVIGIPVLILGIALTLFFAIRSFSDFIPVSFIDSILYMYLRFTLPISLFSVGAYMITIGKHSMETKMHCPYCECMFTLKEGYSDIVGTREATIIKNVGFQGPKKHTLGYITSKETGNTYEVYQKEHAHFIYETEKVQQNVHNYHLTCDFCGGEVETKDRIFYSHYCK